MLSANEAKTENADEVLSDGDCKSRIARRHGISCVSQCKSSGTHHKSNQTASKNVRETILEKDQQLSMLVKNVKHNKIQRSESIRAFENKHLSSIHNKKSSQTTSTGITHGTPPIIMYFQSTIPT